MEFTKPTKFTATPRCTQNYISFLPNLFFKHLFAVNHVFDILGRYARVFVTKAPSCSRCAKYFKKINAFRSFPNGLLLVHTCEVAAHLLALGLLSFYCCRTRLIRHFLVNFGEIPYDLCGF